MTFRWKDYRVKAGGKGKTRYKAMSLSPQQFMRRFLLHVLPGGFHRIRHCGHAMVILQTFVRGAVIRARHHDRSSESEPARDADHHKVVGRLASYVRACAGGPAMRQPCPPTAPPPAPVCSSLTCEVTSTVPTLVAPSVHQRSNHHSV